ncbi:hypothetical protein PHLCEN_2v13509, partial [Hermanssonia centrifuga]
NKRCAQLQNGWAPETKGKNCISQFWKQALWAAKKYSSHCILPNPILTELDAAVITAN